MIIMYSRHSKTPWNNQICFHIIDKYTSFRRYGQLTYGTNKNLLIRLARTDIGGNDHGIEQIQPLEVVCDGVYSIFFIISYNP